MEAAGAAEAAGSKKREERRQLFFGELECEVPALAVFGPGSVQLERGVTYGEATETWGNLRSASTLRAGTGAPPRPLRND